MAAEAQGGIKRHEAEGLGLCGVDNIPDIDAHRCIDDFQLVHHRDVHSAEDVLGELHRLRHAAGLHRHERFDRASINGQRMLAARGRQPADDFQNYCDITLRITQILS